MKPSLFDTGQTRAINNTLRGFTVTEQAGVDGWFEDMMETGKESLKNLWNVNIDSYARVKEAETEKKIENIQSSDGKQIIAYTSDGQPVISAKDAPGAMQMKPGMLLGLGVLGLMLLRR